MREGVPGVCGHLSRTNGDRKNAKHDPNALPSAAVLAAGLRNMAANAKTHAFIDCDSWVEQVKTRQLYDERELTRVLLLLASHHAIPAGVTGLTKAGAIADSTDMLRPERWEADDRLQTIEHVAPQTPKRVGDTWAADLYTDNGFVHRIGNLVLLPGEENSWISNRPWSEKKAITRLSRQSTWTRPRRYSPRRKRLDSVSTLKLREGTRSAQALAGLAGAWRVRRDLEQGFRRKA